MKKLLKIKSQVWSIDLFIAIVILMGTFLIFYKYGVSILYAEEKDTTNLLLDGKLISSYLVSTGYPENWQIRQTNEIALIGLTNGNMDINKDKVKGFSDLTDTAPKYEQTKKLLSTTKDYYVFFEDRNNNTVKIEGVNWIGKNYLTANPNDMIKIVRIVSYNSTLLRMVLYIW